MTEQKQQTAEPKKRGGARKGTGPKGPHGRETKKNYTVGLYPSQVELITKKHGLTLQRWLNKVVEGETKNIK